MFSSIVLRRVFSVFLALFMIFGIFFGQIEKASAYSNLDQYITEADGYFRFLTHPKLGQTFRPTLNKLDGIGVYSGIQPAGPSSCTLTVTLYKNSDMVNPVAHKSTTIYKMEAYTIIDIPAVDVVPEARYTMYATASVPQAYWLAKMSNVYSRGTAIIDSVSDANVDFVFATFGYNGTPPALPDPAPAVVVDSSPTGGDAAADNTSTGASTDTTTSSSTATTSSSVAAPTGLTATAATDGTAGIVNLAWTASTTTGLTGYSVLRSASEKSGFTEVGATDSKTVTYKDDKVVTDQTYYYVVRAYKSGTVSANSNVASIKVTDTTAPAVPANFKISSANESEIVFNWDKNTDSDLANYVLTVAENGNADAKVLAEIDTIGKDENTYVLKLADNAGLKIDTEYTFHLQAKDISTNFSGKATTTGIFAKVKAESKIWLWVGIGAGTIVLAGLIVAFILIRRKKRVKTIT
jgi:hypothetical protein